MYSKHFTVITWKLLLSKQSFLSVFSKSDFGIHQNAFFELNIYRQKKYFSKTIRIVIQ
jgi:hypothetical protein